jgi:dephospho-CoA kinase
LSYGREENPNEQAQRLFAALRELDACRMQNVFVRCPGKEGVGLAVYNRLLRAAAFREVMPNYVIGLTGTTGAGKSTAAAMFAGMGCDVVDCDQLAREIVQPGSPVLGELAACFGEDIVRENGELNRAVLAAKAFENESTRQALNAITHRAITNLALVRMNKAGGRVVVVDAAALLESEIARHCDHIVVITAPVKLRLARILARDDITEDAARQRIAAQAHMDYTGHTTIDNAQGEVELATSLKTFLAQILPLGYGGGAGAADDTGVSLPA